MLLFYAPDEGSGSAGNKPVKNEAHQQTFPEDPGIENGRIPDGGGPADGFINEDGHSTGNGFLGHVTEDKNSADADGKQDSAHTA